MKQIEIILVFTVLSISCGREYTYRQAIRYRSESEVDMVIEYFSRCYYRLPQDIKELEDFIDKSEWREDAEFREKPFFASFRDSVFLYFRKQKIGSCVYGHPIYWLQHPNDYPVDRLDYFENFKISGFDKNGKYVFNCDYDSLGVRLKEISNNYNNVIACKSRVFTPWRDSLTIGPKIFLAECFTEDGTIKIVDEQKSGGDMYLSDKHNPSQIYSVVKNLDIGEEYIKSVEQELLCVEINHPEINKIILPLNIFCNL